MKTVKFPSLCKWPITIFVLTLALTAASFSTAKAQVLTKDLETLPAKLGKPNIWKSKIFRMAVNRPRPTQSGVGMAEVDVRKENMSELNRGDLKNYLLNHVGEVVLGPPEKPGEPPVYYLVDGHHQARALSDLSLGEADTRLNPEAYSEMAVQVVADYSDMKDHMKFVKRMENEGYLFLWNTEGKKISLEDLPKTIRRLKNDSFRAFVWDLIHRNFIKKPKQRTPFFEFLWSFFFRSKISEDDINNHPKKARKMAWKLLQSKEADAIRKEYDGSPGSFARCLRLTE